MTPPAVAAAPYRRFMVVMLKVLSAGWLIRLALPQLGLSQTAVTG